MYILLLLLLLVVVVVVVVLVLLILLLFTKRIDTFWGQKLEKKNCHNSQKILNYIKSSCIIFCAKLFQYSQYIHY